jgi:hypothetical protein
MDWSAVAEAWAGEAVKVMMAAKKAAARQRPFTVGE